MTDHERWMEAALELALRGRGEVEPNPRVGALAIGAGAVVGRGWHRWYGGAHAEVEALNEAQRAGRPVDTIVVTLEPCSSDVGEDGKKTPPCTRAILAAGIRRVVIGSEDGDPRHRGRGVQVLRDAGVDVVTDVLAARCRAINRAYERGLQLDRPWTIAKWAMTLDGKIAAPGGDARWISGADARRTVHELRARVDAVVVGFGTARRDDPELTVRMVEGDQPTRVVVDPWAELSQESRLVATCDRAPVWLLVREDAAADRVAALTGAGVEVLHVLPDRERSLDHAAAWRTLRQRGLRRLLVEGGGRLHARLVEAQCIDQWLAFVAPKIIGGASAPTPVDGAGRPSAAAAWPLDELYWRACGEDLLIGAFARDDAT
ncbi:MAG: bifunctional diaminohydroxyphosphoribosylaminopyrimidine deaminase/5-amino-6-(5-phosphoribosylamino)uracil reductase RibD [Planctomycetota bacterium]